MSDRRWLFAAQQFMHMQFNAIREHYRMITTFEHAYDAPASKLIRDFHNMLRECLEIRCFQV